MASENKNQPGQRQKPLRKEVNKMKRDMNKFTATMAAIGAAAIMAVPAFAAAPAAPAAIPAAAPVPVPVTEEQAKAIALEKAGFTEEQVRRMKVEKDYDDGRLEYDVEFYVNGVEYSCDIDIDTGNITDYDVDFD